jgi:hypothetical protein
VNSCRDCGEELSGRKFCRNCAFATKGGEVYLDDAVEALERELRSPQTTAERLTDLFNEHIGCTVEPCEVCEILDGDVRGSVLLNPSCGQALIDLALNSAFEEGTLEFVDALLAAVTRPDLPEKWVTFAVEYPWRYKVQFEPGVVYHFIHNISKGRSLTEEEKNCIQKANDLENFPSPEEMNRHGWGNSAST